MKRRNFILGSLVTLAAAEFGLSRAEQNRMWVNLGKTANEILLEANVPGYGQVFVSTFAFRGEDASRVFSEAIRRRDEHAVEYVHDMRRVGHLNVWAPNEEFRDDVKMRTFLFTPQASDGSWQFNPDDSQAWLEAGYQRMA